MKKVLLILVLFLPLGLWAQGQGLQIALKGGAGEWLSKENTARFRPMGGMDLNYVIRWKVASETRVGLRTGLGVDYTMASIDGEVTDSYTRKDYLKRTLEYTTLAQASETHQLWQLELPVMFAFKTYGISLDLGVKFLCQVADMGTTTVDQATIVAYLPKYKVPIYNEPATGYLPTPYSQKIAIQSPLLTLGISAALGYEWQVGERYRHDMEHYIGVQVFADYGVVDLTRSTQDAFLSVAPITKTGQVPEVTVGTLAATRKINALNVGLRFYYTIQTVDYEGNNWHRTRR